MSEFWNNDNSFEPAPAEEVEAAVEPEREAEQPTARRRRGRPKRSASVSRSVVEDVLDRFERFEAADRDTLEAVAAVFAMSEHDSRSLTVASLSSKAKRAQALDDLLSIAEAPEADRDMTALSLGMEAANLKRLKDAHELARAVGLADEAALPSGPIDAARAVAGYAVLGQEVLSAARGLI